MAAFSLVAGLLCAWLSVVLAHGGPEIWSKQALKTALAHATTAVDVERLLQSTKEAAANALGTGQIASFGPPSVQELLELPTGFAAMMMCSGLFVSKLPYDVAYDEDCDIACLFSNVTVDYEERSVVASLLITGAWPFKSIYRGDGIGCTVIDGLTEAEIRQQNVGDQSPLPALNDTVPWPLGDRVYVDERAGDVDWATIDRVVDEDFANPYFNTRAVLIVHRGKVVFERYKSGITATSRLIGYSATKSITNAFLGVLANEGRLNVSGPAPVQEWNAEPGDPRSRVSVTNLLHMARLGSVLIIINLNLPENRGGGLSRSPEEQQDWRGRKVVTSGQRWRELPGDILCLYLQGEGDCAGWYARQPQEDVPGSRFEYSTGGSTLLMRIALQQRGEPELTNFEWPRQKLFKRLSMHTALIEAQANTYLLGGSNGYMTARDWARLGYLYLRDGVWVDGTRVFADGWVDFTRSSSPTNPNYAAHFWARTTPAPDLFYMDGARNQNTFVVQSRDLIVVRLAMPAFLTPQGWNLEAFLGPVINAFPPAQL